MICKRFKSKLVPKKKNMAGTGIVTRVGQVPFYKLVNGWMCIGRKHYTMEDSGQSTCLMYSPNNSSIFLAVERITSSLLYIALAPAKTLLTARFNSH